MRTMLAEQTELAVAIAKQHQLLAENFHGLGNVVQFMHRADHQPVAAKPFAGRRPRTDVGNIGDGQFTLSSTFSIYSRS